MEIELTIIVALFVYLMFSNKKLVKENKQLRKTIDELTITNYSSWGKMLTPKWGDLTKNE